ncbi:MAG TPA: OB-fold nucleic acid binding domain-containing protein, partial [Mycobacterium sp.]
LAWAGACDSLVGGAGQVSPRRVALWQLGATTAAQRIAAGTQLTLPLELPQAPAVPRLSRWEEMVADYATTGMTAGPHLMSLLRGQLPAGCRDSRDLAQLPHGSRVRIGGMVVARQRPGTAAGIVFILLEDEFGVINLIVPPAVYERQRLVVRTEPLLLAEGKLERHAKAGGAINVLVRRIGQLTVAGGTTATVQNLAPVDDRSRTEIAADDFRAVAPPVMSFAAGRRR